MVSTFLAGSIIWLIYWYKTTQYNRLKETWWSAHEALDEVQAKNSQLNREYNQLNKRYKELESKYTELLEDKQWD